MEWVNVEGNSKPSLIDRTSSKKYVYLRKNITKVNDTTYTYNEAKVDKETYSYMETMQKGSILPLIDLGTEYTQELKEDISSGTFKKAVVGGYLTINGHKYYFAHPDYWLHTGDTECTKHHMVVVPASNLVNCKMNSSSITEDGYMGSGFKSGKNKDKSDNTALAQIKAIIKADFGADNILTHRELFTNAVTDGYARAGSWYDSDIDLMNEEMVYGGTIFGNILHGTNIPYSYTIDKSQLKLFAERPDLICNRTYWWLRDVISGESFAYVDGNGVASNHNASTSSHGIRPAFGIC